MSESPDRVYRGGSWYNDARYAGRPARGRGFPSRAVINIGFRLVVDTEVERVNRGGCWYGTAAIAHLSFPDANDPTDRGDNLGFRLAKEGT